MDIIVQLAVSTGMVLLTTLVHLAGLAGLLILLQLQGTDTSKRALKRDVLGIVAAALGLIALHGLEIWAYAGLYTLTGAIGDFPTALYFSTSTYSTIGYGDVLLSPAWRVVGAIEGVNGVILLGWSTAFFVGMVRRMSFVESGFGRLG